MHSKKRSSSTPPNPDSPVSDDAADLVVVTPPATVLMEPDYPLEVEPSKSNQFRSLWSLSQQESSEKLSADGNFEIRRKSNSMPSSRSFGSLSLPNESSISEKSFLQLPKYLTRSFSANRTDQAQQLSPDEKPRSRTPQPIRRMLGRTRSSSPHPTKPASGRNAPRELTSIADELRAPWSKTVKFLARKAPSSPFTSTVSKSQKQSQSTQNSPSRGINEVGEGSESASTCTTETPQNESHGLSPLDASISASGSTSGLNGMPGDVPDGALASSSDSQKEHLKQKIIKISEQIKIEQASRDENVAEYLRLSSNADKQQAARMKSVFEKKNQRSKANVAQLQKKLDTYHKRLKELESNGAKPQGSKIGLKEVGAKLTDFSGGVANSVQGILHKKSGVSSKKYGSFDHLPSAKDDLAGSEDLERSNSAEDMSAMSDSGDLLGEHRQSIQSSVNGNSGRPPSPQLYLLDMRSRISTVEEQLNRIKELETQQECIKEEVEILKSQIKTRITEFSESVNQVNYRYSGIQDQLQDLTDMHGREISDIRQEFASLEEKLEYHAQERARDIQEALETCQTRITKMEVQQQHQHQQLITMEGVENATARALLGKLINLVVSALLVVLVFVSTVCSVVMPFIRNQTRVVVSAACVIFVAVLYRYWTPWISYLQETTPER